MFFDSVSCFAVDGQGSRLAGAYGQSDAQRQRHRTGRRWLSQIEDRLLLSVPAGLLRSGRSRQSAALLLGADLRCWHAGAWTQPSLSPGGGGVSRTFEAARATCSAIRCLPVAPDAGARPRPPPAPAAPVSITLRFALLLGPQVGRPLAAEQEFAKIRGSGVGSPVCFTSPPGEWVVC